MTLDSLLELKIVKEHSLLEQHPWSLGLLNASTDL